MGLENQIPDQSNVDYVREYAPTFFGVNKFKQGVKPSDFESKHQKDP
jgi:hypothetical protein